MIVIRLDTRLAARVDPSDVLQDTLTGAVSRLPEYLRDRPVPFYTWLRRLALDRMADMYRRHIRAGNRTVEREEPPRLSHASVRELGERLIARGSSPSGRLRRREQRDRIQAALAALPERDREVLVLRYLEQLPVDEIASVLGLSEGAVYARHLRALQRLRLTLGDDFGEGTL
jgi:RNA polymerase sigma-70 factor (ECF subfamily)